MLKVKLLLKRCWSYLIMDGSGMVLDATTKKDVQPSSPEAWQLKSREVSVAQALAHWKYVSSTLSRHGVPEDELNIAGHHYLTAFEHGWKHGVEYIEHKL